MIVPNQDGPGTRVKFGEALASGAAVVSTNHGAEGFDVGPEICTLADSPDAFASAVIRLLTNRDEAFTMGKRGRGIRAGGAYVVGEDGSGRGSASYRDTSPRRFLGRQSLGTSSALGYPVARRFDKGVRVRE